MLPVRLARRSNRLFLLGPAMHVARFVNAETFIGFGQVLWETDRHACKRLAIPDVIMSQLMNSFVEKRACIGVKEFGCKQTHDTVGDTFIGDWKSSFVAQSSAQCLSH